jgi:hypothetical protein
MSVGGINPNGFGSKNATIKIGTSRKTTLDNLVAMFFTSHISYKSTGRASSYAIFPDVISPNIAASQNHIASIIINAC